MLNAIKRTAQKNVMTVTSWYRIPEKGMDRFEMLAMSSCLPLIANRQYEYKYHFVCPFHVVAPYLFKTYFPDSAYPWLKDVTENNVIVTAEFRDAQGHVTNRLGVHKRLIAHGVRDLCCFHLHKETEAIHALKLYGMDSIKLSTEKALPSNLPSSSQLSKKEDDLPSSLDEIDSFIANAVNPSDRPSLANREEKVFHSPKEESERNPFEPPIVRSLRGEGKPYNTIMACEIDEVTPQRGEPILLAGYRRDIREDEDGRDASLMIPHTVEGRVLKSQEGRSMVMTSEKTPIGMIGGGAFDINGMCKGMIEGIVQTPGATINGHTVQNTHAQNIYENCTALIDASVLADFVGNVELGLLDDMQEDVKRLREEMGDEMIQEEQRKIVEPFMKQAMQKK